MIFVISYSLCLPTAKAQCKKLFFAAVILLSSKLERLKIFCRRLQPTLEHFAGGRSEIPSRLLHRSLNETKMFCRIRLGCFCSRKTKK